MNRAMFQEEMEFCGADSDRRHWHGFYPLKAVISQPQAPVFQNGSLLFFVDSGQGTLKVNGVDIPLGQGAFGWLHSYHLFQFLPDWDESLTLYVCAFDYASASFIAYRSSLTITREVMVSGSPVIHIEEEEQKRVRRLMERYCRIQPSGEPREMLMGYAMFLELSTLYLRYSSKLVEQREPFKRSQVWMLLQHIFTYSNENLTKQDLARLYGMSDKEAGRQLLSLTGLSFPELLNRARIARACDMLNFEGLSQHYIAFYAGYHSEAAFYRVFRAMKHMTPQEYKERFVTQQMGEGQSYLDAGALTVLHYLLRHYREPLTLCRTAGELYMDKTAVNELLRANFGIDFQTLLTELRMSYAKTLLSAGRQPIETVAAACGYQSAHALIRVFKKYAGMTPGEYRRQKGENVDGMHH